MSRDPSKGAKFTLSMLAVMLSASLADCERVSAHCNGACALRSNLGLRGGFLGIGGAPHGQQPTAHVRDEEDRVGERPMKTVPVTFDVRCDIAELQDQVLIIGDDTSLGAWDTQASVALTSCEATWPMWSATVDLPAGQIVEYKYAMTSKKKNVETAESNATEGRSNATSDTLDGTGRSNATSDTLDGTGTNVSSTGNSSLAAKLQEWQFERDGVVFDWEEGGNHIVKVGRRRHTVTDDFMTNNFRNTDPRPPSYVTSQNMGQASGVFLDAEYGVIATD